MERFKRALTTDGGCRIEFKGGASIEVALGDIGSLVSALVGVGFVVATRFRPSGTVVGSAILPVVDWRVEQCSTKTGEANQPDRILEPALDLSAPGGVRMSSRMAGETAIKIGEELIREGQTVLEGRMI